MNELNALILGIVQGLAEYLPISSSGHLEICSKVLGMDTTGAQSLQFDLVLHVATVLSTIVVLWHEFSGLCRSFFTLRRDNNTSLVLKILVSCIPVGIVGVLFKDDVESFFGGNLLVVGVCLLITSALLAFAYFFRTRPLWIAHSKVTSGNVGREINYFDALVIGVAQAVAVLPGLSRSGSTIATGILLGNKRDKLASFSFLMVIIPVLGAGLLDVVKILVGKEQIAGDVSLTCCVIGFVASFVVGCLACKWMINLVRKGKLVWFALYCLAVGLVCLLYSMQMQ